MIKKFDTPISVAQNLADHIATELISLSKSQPIVTFLIAGGSTPQLLYEGLAQKDINWHKVYIFWSDERFVQEDSEESNYKMTNDVLLSKIEIPLENIHPMRTDVKSNEIATKKYEQELKQFFNNALPQWDINILGIGEDCHTASLFPHATSLYEKEKWVIGVDRLKPPPQGITMTFPLLNNSRNIYMLATGANKANALKRIIEGKESVDNCPAAGITGNVEWWVDTAAAKLLKEMV